MRKGKMKKAFVIAMAAIMVFGVTACGGKKPFEMQKCWRLKKLIKTVEF